MLFSAENTWKISEKTFDSQRFIILEVIVIQNGYGNAEVYSPYRGNRKHINLPTRFSRNMLLTYRTNFVIETWCI